MQKSSVIIFLLFQFLMAPLFSEVKGLDILYRWKKVPGARGYILQIKNNKKSGLYLNRRVGENKLRFSIPPGNYLHRIAVINKFRRQSPWTKWIALTVKDSLLPIVNTITPNRMSIDIKKNDKTSSPTELWQRTTLEIRGKHFLNMTEVELVSKSSSVSILEIKTINENKILLSIYLPETTPGIYDLIVKNPGKKIFKKSEAVTFFHPDQSLNIKEKKERGTISKKEIKKRRGEKEVKKRAVLSKKYDFELIKKFLIPGYADFSNGNFNRGLAWSGTIGAFSVGALIEQTKANRIVAEKESNLLTNPLFYMTLPYLPGTFNTSALSMIGLYAFSRNDALKNSYEAHKKNISILGSAAIVSYFSHMALAITNEKGWQAAIPGLTPLLTGDESTGILWLSSFLGLVGASYSEGNLARHQFKGVRAQPLNFFLLTRQNSSPQFLTFYALLLERRVSRQKKSYGDHKRRQGQLGGATALLYVAHAIVQSMGSGTKRRPNKKSHSLTTPRISFLYYSTAKGKTRAELSFTISGL